ncbi:P-loop containing nucleoside triphosphate hydrolase protein [Phellopilus nigrolimitatus]|nr:P-loop containing nucleoside triphosphate hydrolase protein [Phellopilus nigrolimitatus]
MAGSGTATPSSSLDSNLGVGLLDERISFRRRRMLNLVDRLHSVGLQSDIDLPQIAVIGSQSAGKSSLVEAFTGIKLPRASGTCTRCPTECLLKYSNGPWTCKVSLRFIKDINGKALGQAKNVEFGPLITDRDEVEERLRRAQRAILNPAYDYNDFLGGFEAETPELSFSENYVSVQIHGPTLTDLSFCDLPGVIASVGRNGRQDDVDLIKSLSIRYIEKPSCVILLTVSCETDFEVQGAFELARKYDPEGRRTIGVLTKPDRIEEGEEHRWIQYVKNEEEPLELGWFCVKQPDPAQLRRGITWEEARAKEKTFFTTKEPWCSLTSQNLGTANLVERLSDTLSDLIAKRLPELQDELQELLQRTEQSLAELPVSPSSDSLAEMVQLIGHFSADVFRFIEGTPEKDGLLQSIRLKQVEFRHAILSLAPDLRPYKKDAKNITVPAMGFLSREETETVGQGKVLHLDEVMEKAHQARTRELPGNVPFVVTQKIIEEIMRNWEKPVFGYFDSVQAIMLDAIKRLIVERFKRFEHAMSLTSCRTRLEVVEQIKQHRDATKEHLRWLINLERRPFTLNSQYLEDYKDRFLAYYKGCWQKEMNSDVMGQIQAFSDTTAPTTGYTPVNPLEEVLANLNKLRFRGVAAHDLPKLLPKDPLEPALEIMATVRAYFQVSYKRFVDNVPLAIDYDFVQGLGRDIQDALYKSIIQGSGDARERCKAFLQESPLVSAQRENLQRRYERLEIAKGELMGIW